MNGRRLSCFGCWNDKQLHGIWVWGCRPPATGSEENTAVWRVISQSSQFALQVIDIKALTWNYWLLAGGGTIQGLSVSIPYYQSSQPDLILTSTLKLQDLTQFPSESPKSIARSKPPLRYKKHPSWKTKRNLMSTTTPKKKQNKNTKLWIEKARSQIRGRNLLWNEFFNDHYPKTSTVCWIYHQAVGRPW